MPTFDLNRGALAPVADEADLVDLPVTGAIPPELDGTLLRNGPNPPAGRFEGNDVLSWWPEAAMLHAISFERGRATGYRNRWLRTQRWARVTARAARRRCSSARRAAPAAARRRAHHQRERQRLHDDRGRQHEAERQVGKVWKLVVENDAKPISDARAATPPASQQQRLDQEGREHVDALEAERAQRADLGGAVRHRRVHRDHRADHRGDREDRRQRQPQDVDERRQRLRLVAVELLLALGFVGQARVDVDVGRKRVEAVGARERSTIDE
jgi:hypothetical protein